MTASRNLYCVWGNCDVYKSHLPKVFRTLISYLQLRKLAVLRKNSIVSVLPLIKLLWSTHYVTSSIIRQKGESQNGCLKKTEHAKFSEKRTFLTPWYAHVRVRIRGLELFVFRKIWRALFSSNTHFEICPFALLPATFVSSSWKDRSWPDTFGKVWDKQSK